MKSITPASGIRALGHYLHATYPLYLFSVWIVCTCEFLNRGQLADTMLWSVRHTGLLLFNALIILCLILILSAIIGRTRVAGWIVAFSALLISFASGIKLKILGVPLLPWDFVLTGEAKDMTPYLNNLLNMQTIVGLIVFVAISWLLLYRIPRFHHRLKWKEKITLSLLATGMFAMLIFEQPLSYKSVFHLEHITWNQAEHVSNNGFLLASLMNLDILFIDKKTYDRNQIFAFLERYPDQSAAAPDDRTEEGKEESPLPNIIIILSETFWDPTLIRDVNFSQDPMPFFHSLQQKYPSGWLLSPQFGGGTANVEFEVLTGLSMRFLPQGSVPYNQYVTHEVDSLASITGRQGYRSTAISPFHSWYFKSKDVYRYLGFDKYISIEFFDPVYSGPYIADSEVARMIIDETSDSPEPHFIFANTMENHFHYYPGKFEKNTIQVSGEIEPGTRGLLETYATGIAAADNMLQTLVEHYSQQNEPTVIAFFGDHLPVLGDEYKAFIDSNYISGENDPDFLYKMYRLPFLIWNNFESTEQQSLFMSPSFLGPMVLKTAGLGGSSLMGYLSELYEEIPVIPPKNYFMSLNINETDLQLYEGLQQDILFGDRLAYSTIEAPIESPDFLLGADIVAIDEVSLHTVDEKDELTLTVSGPYVPALSVVYINDKPLETHDIGHDTVEAEIPLTYALPDSPARIDVRIIDSENTIIARSNTLSVDLAVH